MTTEELLCVCREDVRRAVGENIGRPAADIALDGRVVCAQTVATQVKRLQRAASKLPSYYAVRAVLPALAYEQSSGEICARRKPLSGRSLLDLTCGLGVDSFALSERFNRVVSVERDEVTAAVARENFRRLGRTNIEVHNCPAEEFLAHCGERFDWCFIDPDRRGAQGEKLVRIEDCSPDIIELLPLVWRVADRLCIKCSPLFDVAEAFRIFGPGRVETVSVGGECKEVNIYLERPREGVVPQGIVAAVAVGRAEVAAPWGRERRPWSALPEGLEQYRYAIIPDAAVHHSRLAAEAFGAVADVWSDRGVALAGQLPAGEVAGRVFAIEWAAPFDTALIRSRIYGAETARRKGVPRRRIEILRRDFPLSNAEICARLRVAEGGGERWCFTRIGDRSVAIALGAEIR